MCGARYDLQNLQNRKKSVKTKIQKVLKTFIEVRRNREGAFMHSSPS